MNKRLIRLILFCIYHEIFRRARSLRPSLFSGFCLLLFSMSAMPASFAQGDQVQLGALPASFREYRARAMQEKIFVHVDKPLYLAGEILWYKIYCVEGFIHTPLDLSTVAYLELLGSGDKPAMQGKVLLEKGEGKGSFYLPPTLNSGQYKLRAYTNWMKNQGVDCFFEQMVTIVNTFKNLPVELLSDSIRPSWHIGFFPEGGNLVNGIRSKVAFQMTDTYGKGTVGRGWVVNEKMDTLTTFQPLFSGIGNFSFKPESGHSYKAIVLFPDGKSLVMEIPAAYGSGFALQVREMENAQLGVHIYASNDLASGDVSLFVRSGGVLHLAGRTALTGDSALVLVDKTLLGEGVNQITLFNSAGKPVCERLYGVRPQKDLFIEAGTETMVYGTRKKVQLSLSAKGEGGQFVPASLSMAVYRCDSLQSISTEGTDIFTYLWLGSDLKGKIESAESYLSGDGEQATEMLDNLMLTHGWRRFRWEDIFHSPSNLSSLTPPEHRGQLITGRLTNSATGEPAKGVIVFLSTPGIQYQFRTSRTDQKGKFVFDIKDFYGAGGIAVQTNTEKVNNYKIEIFSPFSEQYTKDTLPVFGLRETLHNILQENSLGMQVQNVYAGDSLKKYRIPAIDSFRFYGKPDYTYKLDDYVRFTTMEEVLREYVREVNVNRWHGHLHVLMLNEPLKQFFEDNNTLVLLDGIQVMDDKIFSYDPLKVNRLEVIPRQYILGPSTFSGILSFTTYKGDYEGLELDARSLLIDYEGLQLPREFYSPVYATDQDAASRVPDFRNLLFWSPDIHTDNQGKKDYSFYTSDLPGKYRVVIQGITEDGKAGVKSFDFEVK
ncbi:hypothetical protein ACX0G9_03460 [Flavitalea flava]